VNTQGRETRSRTEEKSSLVGSLGSSGIQVLGYGWVLKVTKGFMMVLKGDRTTNLYKVIGSVVISDASLAIEKDTTRIWHIRLGHMSE